MLELHCCIAPILQCLGMHPLSRRCGSVGTSLQEGSIRLTSEVLEIRREETLGGEAPLGIGGHMWLMKHPLLLFFFATTRTTVPTDTAYLGAGSENWRWWCGVGWRVLSLVLFGHKKRSSRTEWENHVCKIYVTTIGARCATTLGPDAGRVLG